MLLIMAMVLGTGAAATASADQYRIDTISLSDLDRMIAEANSRWVIVFMAAWCRPCREELPTVNKLYRKFGPKGLRFAGISIDAGGPAAMEKLLRKQAVDFPVFWVGEAVVDKMRLFGVPMIYLIKDGKTKGKIPGRRSYGFLQDKLNQLLE